MKKGFKKFSVLVLLLCICMLMFGVYALKYAKLEVGGTVGLKVYYAAIEASATIKGDAVLTSTENGEPVYTRHEDGYASPERELFDVETIGSENVEIADLEKDIGLVYFTDLTPDGVPHNITIKVNIKNKSNYDIALNTSVTVDDIVEATIADKYAYSEDSYIGYSDNYVCYLAKEQDTEIYVTFKLLMDAESQDYLAIAEPLDFEILFEVKKYDTRQPNTFSSSWKSRLNNQGVNVEELTEISFENVVPNTNDYTMNSQIDVGNGIATFVSNDNKKVVFYSDNVINLDTNASGLFANLKALTNITFNNINTSNVTDMSSMFAANTNLLSLDLTNFDLTNTTDLNALVVNCHKLKSVDLTGCTASKITDLNHFACDAWDLETVTFGSNFVTSNLTNIRAMFARTSIKDLDLSSFNFSKVNLYYDLFCQTDSIKYTNAIKVANSAQYNYLVNGINSVNYWNGNTYYYKENNRFSASYVYFD